MLFLTCLEKCIKEVIVISSKVQFKMQPYPYFDNSNVKSMCASGERKYFIRLDVRYKG